LARFQSAADSVERIGIVAEFARLIWLRIFAGPIGVAVVAEFA
jgi:hypothetical protein